MSNESDMLFDVPISGPPRIVQLRRAYDEEKAAYDAAVAFAEELDVAVEIPPSVVFRFREAERLLRKEESWIAANKL